MNIIFDVLYDPLTIDEKRKLLKEVLQQGEVVVDFRKVNGDLRTMPCTLAPDLLPIPSVKVVDESKPARKVPAENPDVIRVFCTDKQEWRSFRIDSVISIATIDLPFPL